MSNRRAHGTAIAYARNFSHYSQFLLVHGLLTTTAHGPSIPNESLTPVIYIYFLAHLYRCAYAPKTIAGITAAVRAWARDTARVDPTAGPDGRIHPQVYGVFRAIKRLSGPPRKRFPITTAMLLDLHQIIHGSDQLSFHLAPNIWAAQCLAFLALLRVSEYTKPNDQQFDPSTHAQRRDVKFHFDAAGAPRSVTFLIKESKTDPFREGMTVHIYKSGSKICAVTALWALFNNCPADSTEPLFDFSGQCTLPDAPMPRCGPSRTRFTALLHCCLLAAGINDGFISSHSLRQGGATALAAAGAPSWLIKILGRWRSHCYEGYLPVPISTVQDLAKRIANAPALPGVQADNYTFM